MHCSQHIVLSLLHHWDRNVRCLFSGLHNNTVLTVYTPPCYLNKPFISEHDNLFLLAENPETRTERQALLAV